jgi:hypothetical protein
MKQLLRIPLLFVLLALVSGCTAPMVEKNYGVQVFIYATNVVWNVEALVEKSYEAELKGSLK